MENDHYKKELNAFLVEVFNDILKAEEIYVTESCTDLSVTAGTLTTAVNQLEAKGYLERVRDGSDKRSVRLYPTEKGREADARHTAFHRELVEATVETMTMEEAEVLARGLNGIASFIRKKYLE